MVLSSLTWGIHPTPLGSGNPFHLSVPGWAVSAMPAPSPAPEQLCGISGGTWPGTRFSWWSLGHWQDTLSSSPRSAGLAGMVGLHPLGEVFAQPASWLPSVSDSSLLREEPCSCCSLIPVNNFSQTFLQRILKLFHFSVTFSPRHLQKFSSLRSNLTF